MRFQILRGLIPHSDQKRDTASFLLEVIDHVQFLQEKVQKYEGTYQDWSSEPTKLMQWCYDLGLKFLLESLASLFSYISCFSISFAQKVQYPLPLYLQEVFKRNSHWLVQSFAGQPHAKNGSDPGSIFPRKFDDSVNPTMLTSSQNPLESDPSRDVACKIDQQSELANKGISLPTSLQGNIPSAIRNDIMLVHPLHRSVSDAQSNECPTAGDIVNQEELTVEGGTISISSVYSQGLLNSLTQALENAGLDLSQANISVQINLGKRSDRKLMSGTSIEKDPENNLSGN
ncbi:transcription factor BIM2-like isoform X2 [Mangifera indica]|uniref:transcription factor BIM2-like isoform X2 n=1 Tax=Mangifera indica TaxID=29780 RepID=UPI001CFA71A3|nr:transcription factor BIM2-like isoform X2 [Mangifera indica]